MSIRYIALADLHLVFNNPVCRLDNLVNVQWEKLTYIFEYAVKKRADILIAGDIHVTSNNYSLLNQLIVFLRKYKKRGVTVYAVYGQHDLKYRNPDDTNLQILINGGYIRLLDAKGIEVEDNELRPGGRTVINHRLFGTSWMSEYPVPANNKVTNILVIHQSISPSQIYPGQKSTEPKTFLEKHPNFDIVICGDIHRTFLEEQKGRFIMNPGPLLRREAEEYNLTHKPGFFFIDIENKKINFLTVPHRPAKEVITRKHIEEKKQKQQTSARADTSQFLTELRARTSNRKTVNIRDRIQGRIESNDNSLSDKTIEVFEWILNGKKIKKYVEERK